MRNNKYVLYKRIMKQDLNAIDEITSLEESKELIRMIAGTINLNREINQMEQEQDRKFRSGDEKTIAEAIEKFTAYRKANIEPDEDLMSKHRCKLCGVYIAANNLEVCNKCASEYQF